MEQIRFPLDGPDPGMYGSDRDVFARVWQRVMPEEQENSPIELNSENTLSLVPAGASALPAPPPEKGDPSHGSGLSGGCEARIRDFIALELGGCGIYQLLAARSGAAGTAVFAGIADEKMRHARQLRAAHFLLSGRYLPLRRPPALPVRNYLDALRHRFVEERNQADAYLGAAAEATDREVHNLYLAFADDGQNYVRLIRTVLERM